MTVKRMFACGVVALWAGTIAGCHSGDLDPLEFSSAAARAGGTRPVSTEVPTLTLAYDPSLPKFLVVVEPFAVAASGATSGTGPWTMEPGQSIGRGISSQLLTALTRAGNMVVIDSDLYHQNSGGTTGREGVVGPFIIKGTVTEFHETAELATRAESSNSVPWALVPYIGPLIVLGRGSDSNQETARTGVVVLDIQIINPRTGGVIVSFPCQGTFTAIGQTQTRTRWGQTKLESRYAASALGQAQRLALNQAIQEIHSALARHIREDAAVKTVFSPSP